MNLIELTLHTAEIQDLHRFYAGILGLREMQREDGLSVQVGGSRLNFRSGAPDFTGRYHVAFQVPDRRFDASVRWLQERTGLLTDLTGQMRFESGSWNARMVYFSDPRGNILELIAMRSQDPSSSQDDRPFIATEIIGIAEIGLAADTVTGCVATLTERMPGLAVFSGEGSDTFTAVGDANARIIVARRGRIWFPDTGVPADLLPLEIVLETDTGLRYRINAPPYPFDVRGAG